MFPYKERRLIHSFFLFDRVNQPGIANTADIDTWTFIIKSDFTYSICHNPLMGKVLDCFGTSLFLVIKYCLGNNEISIRHHLGRRFFDHMQQSTPLPSPT